MVGCELIRRTNKSMRIVLAIGLLFCGAHSLAQNLSNTGKEFWVGYGHHQFMEPGQSNSQQMVIYLNAIQPARVTVSIDSTGWTRTYNIPANTVISTEFIPKAGFDDARLYTNPPSFGGTGGEGVFQKKGIHIVSDVPIVAYAHIYGSASSGATMLMPVETWGYEYISLNSQQNYASNCYSWMFVVAKHDSTIVEIKPSAPTRHGKPANVPFTQMLMKGQIYQLVGANLSGNAGYELTGTTVKSIANAQGKCYPIAVFSGSSRTNINCIGNNSSSGDNNIQQVFPYQAWGKRYLTAPTSLHSSATTLSTNIYKVLVKHPGTIVKRNGTTLTSLINGSYYQFESNTADYIEADKPILVGQFMSSTGGCPNTGGGVGDPEMIYISPLEQGKKNVGFFRNSKEAISVNYLTLIIPTPGLPSLKIDGTSTFTHTYPHPNMPGYTVVIRRWSVTPGSDPPPGQCLVESDSAFTAISYGQGSVESYGYNAGALINNLAAASFIHNEADPTVPSHQFTCRNTPVEISMLVAYKPSKIVWQLSQVPGLNPNTDITDLSPAVTDSLIHNGARYYRYRLPGTYTFAQTGTFELPVENTHSSLESCNNTETVLLSITVRDKPSTDFSHVHNGCIKDSVQFMAPASSGNGYTLNRWEWTFPDATSSQLQNPVKLFNTTGTQTVNLKVITAEGCVGDTAKDIMIFDKPVTSFGTTPPQICEGSNIVFTDTSSYAGPAPITSWYWDFGNGHTINTTDGNPQNEIYGVYGTFTVKHVVKVGNNACVSDTATRIVTVYAKPVLGFTYPAGCLPADGVVQFTSTTTAPDGQALTDYSWDFGDAYADASNPNTSTLPNPTHIYTVFGNYNIFYSVTTANGCGKDTVVAVSFNLRPVMEYTALPAICENATGPVSVANATVTNGVPGTGTYRGPGTNAAGDFNPAAAGFGLHTIWYVFTSSSGCTDSISQTIRVHAKPRVNFGYPSGGCLPITGLVQFTDSTLIGDGQILSWAWDFDDPNANAGNPNTSTLQHPTHNFIDGNYDIKLTVTTENGCVADTTIASTFSLRPQLVYPALPAICESIQGTVSIATAAVTNGSTGTGVYRGPGTDAAGNFSPSNAGFGTHTIWYIFTTAGGCKDSISQTILVHAKPLALYTIVNQGACLPTNGLVQFTNLTGINDGQSMTYLWDFGDPNANAGNPNTSTLQHPTHNFQQGIYSISLTATSSNGCVGITSITLGFRITPELVYPPLPSICENAAPVSVASATVVNSATGTAFYRGPGTDGLGNFNPAVAGPGTHTIWYVFTAQGGCKDSVSSTIKVHPKPVSVFNVTPDVCLGQSATITDNSNIATGRIVSWNWDFGNSTNATYNNGNPFSITYANYNVYQVKLVTVSDSGCTSNPVTKPVNVHPLPVANFDLPAAICMPDGLASFVNRTSVPDNSALSFQWNFGDGGPGSTAASPTHTYSNKGPFNVLLTARSAHGCTHDTVKILNAFYDKPIAGFSVSPDTLCQGTENVFTDLSSPTDSIAAWNWTFGDGSTATASNPSKRYALPGNYDVRLTVTSKAGCVSNAFTDKVIVYLQPVIDAGPSFVVPQGTLIQFNPKANDSSVLRFSWSPAVDFTNANVLRPTLRAMRDQTYTLTATGQGNCTASDFLTVKILKPVKVPNAFSPNGDGINDRWVLENLSDYAGATVEVFNRYGQMVFRATGQSLSWDGTYNGKPLPVATYYYIIDLRNGFAPMKGPVTIIK